MMKKLLIIVSFALAQPGHAIEINDIEIALVTRGSRDGMRRSSATEDAKHAIKLAIADKEKQLASKGIKIKVKNFYFTEKSASIIPTLSEVKKSKVVAAVGVSVSRYATLAGKSLKGSDLTLITPYATSSVLKKYTDNIFMVAESNSMRAIAIETFIKKKLKPKKIVSVVSWDRAYSKDLFNNMSEDFKKNTKLFKVLDDFYNVDKVALEVAKLKPDVVFLPNFSMNSSSFVKAFSRSDFKGVYVAGDSWGESKASRFNDLTKGIGYKGYSIRQYSKSGLTDRGEKLKIRIKKSGVGGVSIVAILHYDAMSYVLDRILEIDSDITRKKLNLAMRLKPVHNGISGRSCFLEKSCETGKFHVIEFDGKGNRHFDSLLIRK